MFKKLFDARDKNEKTYEKIITDMKDSLSPFISTSQYGKMSSVYATIFCDISKLYLSSQRSIFVNKINRQTREMLDLYNIWEIYIKIVDLRKITSKFDNVLMKMKGYSSSYGFDGTSTKN